MSKRLFDLALVLITAPLTLAIGAVICVLLLVREGRPIFYRAHRSGQGGRVFKALKFRTMRELSDDEDNSGVSGGDKTFRISRFSGFLRRTRLDELPQLVNVLKGDMSLVGPRPPDPAYVDRFPDIYATVLRSRPGLTGLATLHMHRFEDRVLRGCTTAAETDAVYCRRCIPRKARLDLMYRERIQRPGVVCYDSLIIARSVRSVLK
ncbi:sugar transferase [Aliishimia ponticola]|uniref:Sugar transferase n=1 Tax=Aliishimia ponticola TaxID=2499833 RepID=A0A4S4NHJ9_9RHOB|nr:sugar transferase [Aliishimia ponticola]